MSLEAGQRSREPACPPKSRRPPRPRRRPTAADGPLSQLALTGDGRVVTGGWDGRVYCARLEGGAPVPLAQHDGEVRQLARIDDQRVVSAGTDGALLVTDLSVSRTDGVFVADVGFSAVRYGRVSVR
jgi:hypothetical protein